MSAEIQSQPAYRRVLLKISGEALMGEQNFGIDVDIARSVAEEVKTGTRPSAITDRSGRRRQVTSSRSAFSKSAGKMDRSSADYIGMLATVMNAVVLQDRSWKKPAFQDTTCCPRPPYSQTG